ncbi:nucleoside hydrolase [Crenobacter sp. SG2303]|uniref:Nucleoside hydrolase n=1 Tax=Crenobacter oryzisoli TaxID=3056844 RepID=A0ABT7XIB1_9NEIS|nr:nucleoside hydrolase [Crenobacter sp. SG2303]MDN0073529.1 nucleoside hydrolase [Crenobacter sp. SG2303]
MTYRQDFILDTDPGLDDAVAILFALGASERLNLLALTTVAGNVPLSLTTRNARVICDWAERYDVPVFAGCDRPLVRPLVTAEEVHGKTGLDGLEIHDPQTPQQGGHAVDFIIDTLRAAKPASVTLGPLGPLTNIALALVKAPDISTAIKEIVLMGGTYFEAGNITPAAEFNIYVDPHAAAIVLGSGVPITMMPLDVTHKACITGKRIDKLRSLPNRAGKRVADILTSYARFDTQKFGLEDGPLHDPCVIAYLLEPGLFGGRRVNVQVETMSPLTLGATVVDWWGTTTGPANVNWITEIDAEGFFALLTRTLAPLP